MYMPYRLRVATLVELGLRNVGAITLAIIQPI